MPAGCLGLASWLIIAASPAPGPGRLRAPACSRVLLRAAYPQNPRDTVLFRNCIEFLIVCGRASEMARLPSARCVPGAWRAGLSRSALPVARSVPYAGAVPDGGRQGQGGGDRRAPIV